MRQRLWMLAILGLTAFMPSRPASACYVCQLSGGVMSCNDVIGETGGGDCLINCNRFGTCFCRTLNFCAGSNGCGGQPCPVAKPQGPVSQGDREPIVWLTKSLFVQVSTANPDAAMLLSSLTRDTDVFLTGHIDRVAFIPGDYRGMFTQKVPGKNGAAESTLSYRYKASAVVQSDGSLRVRLEVFDHPAIQVLTAQIWNGEKGSLIEVEGRDHRSQRIEL